MLIRISAPRISRSDGFSLIELLVVVGLIGLITLFALPSVTSYFKISLNSASREIAGVVKEAYNSTIMTGKVNRLVYNLKDQSYMVEIGPPTLLLDTSESKAKEERRKRFAKDSDQAPPSGFSLNRIVTRKEISLPRGVEFEDVITEQSPEPIREGKAFTHFFPHGITEQTILHLKDSSNHQVSLVISAITGQTRLIEHYADAQEIYGK